MAHPIKCACCGVTFDRDKIQAVKYNGRRYAHQTGFPQGEIVPLPIKEIDEDLENLFEYAKQLLGENYNHARVKKQIKVNVYALTFFNRLIKFLTFHLLLF